MLSRSHDNIVQSHNDFIVFNCWSPDNLLRNIAGLFKDLRTSDGKERNPLILSSIYPQFFNFFLPIILLIHFYCSQYCA